MTIKTRMEKGLAGVDIGRKAFQRRYYHRIQGNWWLSGERKSRSSGERSQRSQSGEISSFPKKPMKFYIILNKSTATTMKTDRDGGEYSQQGFQKRV